MPNIAIIQELRERYKESDLQLLYIGEKNGLEEKLMEMHEVPFKPILCGKLRRYLSWRNFVDAFKIPIGIFQSLFMISSFRPTVIFCKGGYISFPVAVAGWLNRVPVYLHESDVIPGLSNRMSSRFARKICVSFEEGKSQFPADKVIYTGNPVRRELANGVKAHGKAYTGFKDDIPVLLFMGGSQGADFINKIVWENFNSLLPKYNVVHICGKGKVKESEDLLKILSAENKVYIASYRAFGFVANELRDLYALADIVISRAGANTLSEIDFFDIPAILIPLSKKASRGDQIKNATFYAKNHSIHVMEEDNFDNEKFLQHIKQLLSDSKHRVKQSPKEKKGEAVDNIIKLLEKV